MFLAATGFPVLQVYNDLIDLWKFFPCPDNDVHLSG
jgi:hypothetical protein